MVEEKEYHYTVDSNGKRALDEKSELSRTIDYLKQGNLYPFELNKDSINKLIKNISSKVDLHEPAVFIYEGDIHKSIFCSLISLINLEEARLKGDMAQYIYYKVSDLSHITQNQLSGEYHDSSEEFDNYKALFIKLNFTDFPNLLNAYCIRNLAQSRKEKGLYTFFFFFGTVAEFTTRNKWKIDEEGIGQKGVIQTDRGYKDSRDFIPLTRFVKYYDINQWMKAGDKK